MVTQRKMISRHQWRLRTGTGVATSRIQRIEKVEAQTNSGEKKLEQTHLGAVSDSSKEFQKSKTHSKKMYDNFHN